MPITVQVRAAGDATGPMIAGHGAVFNSLSHDFGGWREQIAPGAFTRTLKSGGVIRSFFNHNPMYVLGRSDNQTLSVAEDLTGLAFQVSPPNTSWATDLLESMGRGDIADASFAFRTVKDQWNTQEDGTQVRTLKELELFELGPVTEGMYPAADSAVRSFLLAHQVDLAELRAVPDTFPDALEMITQRGNPLEPGHLPPSYRYRVEYLERRYPVLA